jgi:DNA modification methylase
MAVKDQAIHDRYAIYCGDAMEVMPTLPDGKIHLSVYSPPFGGLYHYSSSERDLSNTDDYDQFFEMYAFFVREIHRLTMPGRMTAVHCADLPSGNTGHDYLIDFSGDIIRLHEREGWNYVARYSIWKEPLGVRNRTMAKSLAHQTVVQDASKCSNAAADYLLVFRRKGTNPVPIENPTGFTTYAGERPIPSDVLEYKNWKGKQTQNRYSHWIWRQYASAFWDDIRLSRVLPFKESRDEDDEKHVHPLQLDVIERVVQLWSNHGETILTPFMGVGSEVWGALRLGRRAIGIELKPSYYAQSKRNIADALRPRSGDQETLFEQTA